MSFNFEKTVLTAVCYSMTAYISLTHSLAITGLQFVSRFSSIINIILNVLCYITLCWYSDGTLRRVSFFFLMLVTFSKAYWTSVFLCELCSQPSLAQLKCLKTSGGTSLAVQ